MLLNGPKVLMTVKHCMREKKEMKEEIIDNVLNVSKLFAYFHRTLPMIRLLQLCHWLQRTGFWIRIETNADVFLNEMFKSERNRHFNECWKWNKRIECPRFYRSESISFNDIKHTHTHHKEGSCLMQFFGFALFFMFFFVLIQVLCFWQLICGMLQFQINWQRHNVVLISLQHGNFFHSIHHSPKYDNNGIFLLFCE